MRSSRALSVPVILLIAATAQAAHLDFKDPRRAVGREDDIRIDAQLSEDTISSSSPVSVTYQIENLSNATVAIADRVTAADYDPESSTITLSIGAEVPSGPAMPHLVAIKPGEKRVMTTASYAHVVVPSVRTPWTSTPRFVSIRVAVLRDVAAFTYLIERQSAHAPQPAFPDALFDRWVEGTDSVSLNPLPIRWKTDNRAGSAESDRPHSAGGGTF